MGIDSIVKKWEDKGLDIYAYERDDRIVLSQIIVPKAVRSEGMGTGFMEELVKYADKVGKKITLTPSKDYGATSVSRLKGFYKRFDFVENKGRNKDYRISDTMYRLPKGEMMKDKIARELLKVARELSAGIGYELYAKGADRIAKQTEAIKEAAEKVAKLTRENKSLKIRKKAVKDLEGWINTTVGELKQLKEDIDNLEGYK